MKTNKPLSMSDFILPDSTNLEVQLLAELVSFPETINDVRPILKGEYFTDEKRSVAFKALCEMDEKREDIDIITLGQKAGQDFVISTIVPALANVGISKTVKEHAAILAERYIRKMAYISAIKILQQTVNDTTPVEGIIGTIDAFREDLLNATSTENTVTLTEALNSLADSLQSADKHITTGFGMLDGLTYGGFEAGQLSILSARPSVGKTAVTLYMAHEAARAGKKVHIYSLEMTKEELAKRFMFALETIRPYDLSSRNINWNTFEQVVSYYEGLGIFINDKINSIDEIVAEITSQSRKGNIDAVYIDYLGLIREVAMETEAGRKANTIAMVTKRLKDLAKTLHIPIILLCQLNRNSVLNGQNRPPVLADLRDSGAIEQDADIVLMLEPKQVMVEAPAEEGSTTNTLNVKDTINMWVRKNRNGKRNVAIVLETNMTHTRYWEVDMKTE